MDYNILKTIKSPEDVKKLDKSQIDDLCLELRDIIIDTVSKNGGHLASNLGVVELTVAIHRAFSSPDDSIIFDVGHQCYAHKLLTGRFDKFNSIRTEGGLSGYMRPDESVHDPFVTGHSSNSISAAYGIYKAKMLNGENGTAVAVIGDGAMTGGMTYEALNNAGSSKNKFIVILNDNQMSISKNVGALARAFSKLRIRPKYHSLKFALNDILLKIPLIGKPLYNLLFKIKEFVKAAVYRNNFFVSMGFNYLGPVDGHNVASMESLFKIAQSYNKPTLIHVVTTKGKGYSYAETSPKNYHGVSPFDIEKGTCSSSAETYSDIAGKTLCSLALNNSKICAITAAMTSGTGLTEFSNSFKSRFFDVGIAEQHAVTFAAGLAKGGMIPFFAVYSSFLQRGYDQVLHDAAIAQLPIKLLIDRAGFVGEDGETHQGIFDVAFLRTIPGITIYSPCYYNELEFLIEHTADNKELCAIRYPRGCQDNNLNKPISGDYTVITKNCKKAVITYGRVFSNVINSDCDADIIKLNKIYPIDLKLVNQLISYESIYFFEEGIKSGGIAEHLGNLLSEMGYNGKYKVFAVDNEFVPSAHVSSSLRRYKLDADSINTAVAD